MYSAMFSFFFSCLYKETFFFLLRYKSNDYQVSGGAFQRLGWRCSLFLDNDANNNLAAKIAIVCMRSRD